MKVRIIFGAIIIVLGLFVAIGPQVMFKPCDNMLTVTDGTIKDDGTVNITRRVPMRCVWTAGVDLGIGIMIALLGAALIIFPSVKVRFGLAIGTLLASIFTFLLHQNVPEPNSIFIGVCRGAAMLCRQGFAQALTSLSILLILSSALYVVYLAKKKD